MGMRLLDALLSGVRPESARADSGRAKIPKGVRFAAAARLCYIKPLTPLRRTAWARGRLAYRLLVVLVTAERAPQRRSLD